MCIRDRPWAILKGLKETGVTLFRLDEGTDTGDIIGQEVISLSAKITATELDVYKRQAKKNVQSIQSTYTQTRTSLDSVKHSLCLATGWQFNADPDIREVPGADMNRIAAMNPDVDKQTALQNNYDLNYNKKILKNMTEGSTDKKNMERTIKNLEETVAASMVNLRCV